MSLRFFSENDLQGIAAKGIHPSEILRQLVIFRRGVKPTKLIRPARIGDGIVQVMSEEKDTLVSLHDQAAGRGRMLKFVPASGAASRMFKEWQSCSLRGRFDSDESSVKFLQDIVKLAFYDDLKRIMASDGKNIEGYIRDKRCADILGYILTPKGVSEKVTQTYKFLQRKLDEFERLKHEIETLRQENHEEFQKNNRNTSR